MRVTIDCDPEHYESACEIMSRELRDWQRRYDRVGYGWSHYLGGNGVQCFVRRIKDGLSLKQLPSRRPVTT